MPFSVTLYADSQIKDNVKYRSGGLANSTVITTLECVMNGAIANSNIYMDNSVELSAKLNVCASANYIALNFGNTIIAGQITGLDYINDDNTSVQYAVDHFTSAQMTNSIRGGFFTSCFGLCKRTNLTYPSESVVNQQPEPFSGNDYRWNDEDLTQKLNDEVKAYTGIVGATDHMTAKYRLVMWLSPFAVSALANNGLAMSPWDEMDGSLAFTNKIKLVTEFGLGSNATDANRLWFHSYATGFPIVFKTAAGLTGFVNRMLSNIGERIHIPAMGIDNEDADKVRRYAVITGSYFYSPQEYDKTQQTQMQDVEMEMTRVITNDDIFRVQLIPQQFCVDTQWEAAHKFQMSTGYNLSNFNPLRDERTTILPDGTVVNDYSKSKLMTYPYWYFEIETRIGNKLTIMPQIHMEVTDAYLNPFRISTNMRFVGGEMPKLQIASTDFTTHDKAPEDPASATVWHTIFEYPSISWANNVSSQQQVGELQARMNRVGQQQSAILGASIKGTGFNYGYRGGKPNIEQQGLARAAMTSLGNLTRGAFSAIQFGAGNLNPAMPGTVGGFGPKYSMQNQLDAQTALDNAGRIVTTNPLQIMGEGSIEMLLSQPLICYRCGMTDGELWGFARFIERKGQAVHANINPLTNGGEILGGQASITSYGGKTYYEFMDLDVVGTMPIEFKNAIQSMFCGGCYLIG